MSEVKQIPSLERCDSAFVETMPQSTDMFLNAEDVREYIKEVVKYTLEQAAEKGKVVMQENCHDHTPYWGACVTCGRYDNPEVPTDIIDQQSILSLEDGIIKDLKL